MNVLGKVAIGLGFSIPVAAMITRRGISNKVRESKSYREVMECVHSHEEVKKHLGEPIIEGRFDLSDREANGEKNDIKWYTIPLSGPKNQGNLRYWIMITDRSKGEFHVPKIELRLKNDEETSILIRAYKETEVIATKK